MSIVSSKPTITRKDLEGVLDCMINDELISGGMVSSFEKALVELSGSKNLLAVHSPTAAFHLVLCALEARGKEVIIPSYSSQAALNAISLCGAEPVLVDIDQMLYPDCEQVLKAITERSAAIVLTHTIGVAGNYSALEGCNIPIIEDISALLGSDNLDLASLKGNFQIITFTPNDVITTGNGAAIISRNARHHSLMNELRYSASKQNFEYFMTDLQGAMGLSQISRMQDFVARRREIAKIYYDRARLTPHKVLFPYNDSCPYQHFPIIFDAPADKTTRFFKKNGIELYQPVSVSAHQILEKKGMDYPNADRMSKKLFSLPLYPTLTRNEVEKISRTLAKFI